jgi:hypothetical protein
MSPAVLSCVIFALTLGGIVLGALLRSTLPQHHLSKESQDVVRLGVGLIATIAALVLGLLIAAAKGSFGHPERSSQTNHRRHHPARRFAGAIWPGSDADPWRDA